MAVALIVNGTFRSETAPDEDPPFALPVAVLPAPVAAAVRVPARLNSPVFCEPVI